MSVISQNHFHQNTRTKGFRLVVQVWPRAELLSTERGAWSPKPTVVNVMTPQCDVTISISESIQKKQRYESARARVYQVIRGEGWFDKTPDTSENFGMIVMRGIINHLRKSDSMPPESSVHSNAFARYSTSGRRFLCFIFVNE